MKKLPQDMPVLGSGRRGGLEQLSFLCEGDKRDAGGQRFSSGSDF